MARQGAARRAMRRLLGRRLPEYSGSLAVPGLDGPVEIRRDRFAVPHIYAGSAPDAYFALGWCHAQDRSFQIEILVRLARGTLAELVGEAGLPIDRLARRLGFWRNGRERRATMAPEPLTVIDAYAAGVRAGRLASPTPHELSLLRSRPTPFVGDDVLAILALEGFLLSGNWDAELSRLLIATLDGPEALAAVDPAYPDWHPVVSAADAAAPLARFADDAERLAEWAGMLGGSNSWAISGDHSATGRPILANDPHLSPTLPPHWYLCHLETPDWSVAGASFVGTPGIPSGHNGHVAWGVTAGLADVADLFIEEIHGDVARGPDGDEPCEVRTESITVKGRGTFTERVVVTRRGPVVSPALDHDDFALSLRSTWMWSLPGDGLLALHTVRSFDEFREVMAGWPATSFGLTYADADGHIGYLLAGALPVRKRGDGSVPLPAWVPGTGWEDEPADPANNPWTLDPERGFVVTANNRPSAHAEPWLGIDFIDGYRAAAITSGLQSRPAWDIAGTMQLQLDVTAVPWQEIREPVLTAIAGAEDLDPARAALEDWDGKVAAHSPAASLYELFMAEMDHRIVVARAPRSAEWAVGRGFNPIIPYNILAVRRTGRLSGLLRSQPESWFDGGWGREIVGAMRTALRMASDEAGIRPWGEIRPVFLRHPLAQRPWLENVFNLGPLPLGGDGHTINQAGPDPLRPASPLTLAIASLRTAIDVGAWEHSRFSLPGGQSGNPLSEHYADQLPLWMLGDGIPIHWHRRDVEAATHHRLELLPA